MGAAPPTMRGRKRSQERTESTGQEFIPAQCHRAGTGSAAAPEHGWGDVSAVGRAPSNLHFLNCKKCSWKELLDPFPQLPGKGEPAAQPSSILQHSPAPSCTDGEMLELQSQPQAGKSLHTHPHTFHPLPKAWQPSSAAHSDFSQFFTGLSPSHPTLGVTEL